jgi:biopolymer transport protein ExbD
MRIGSPWPEKKARIEIIPLIDIMFFLLASFMMASLSMMRLQSLKMNLPSATVAKANTKPDMVKLMVDQLGNISIDKQGYDYVAAQRYLTERSKTNSALPVFISANHDATYDMVIHILDMVKAAGIEKVSFDIAPQPGGNK